MTPQASSPVHWVAFLKAINVGGHTVKMERLRTLFSELGLARVETFIASGNVIFEAPAAESHQLKAQIESQLRQALGYKVPTVLRTTTELAAIATYQAFPDAERDATADMLYIAFLDQPPSAAGLQQLMTYRSSIDDFHVHQREVYWLCRKTMSQSPFSGALLEKALGQPATLRNVSTVRKLAVKYPAG